MKYIEIVDLLFMLLLQNYSVWSTYPSTCAQKLGIRGHTWNRTASSEHSLNCSGTWLVCIDLLYGVVRHIIMAHSLTSPVCLWRLGYLSLFPYGQPDAWLKTPCVSHSVHLWKTSMFADKTVSCTLTPANHGFKSSCGWLFWFPWPICDHCCVWVPVIVWLLSLNEW